VTADWGRISADLLEHLQLIQFWGLSLRNAMSGGTQPELTVPISISGGRSVADA
jgi:hypothetical protein